MLVKNMFARDIERDIKGVIKVGQDDDANVKQELEEYVVTKELNKHFADFFSNYRKSINQETDAMGVWISGFFGSGKSHFLKIISYLLENKEVEGKKAIDYFLDGQKIKDEFILADIKRIEELDNEVILFNIDSKASADSKSNKDGILQVFLRVFNERQGFCGAHPFVAELEREFTEEGIYEDFKNAFFESSGTTWESKRQAIMLNQKHFIKAVTAIGRMTEDEAKNWCSNAKSIYSISISDFAELINKHCKKMGKNHKLIFLVDEIGQYIAEDSNLMLNLQSIVEDLGKLCKGRAWVVVTSQQAIDSITKTKAGDFSKIMGRFDTKLTLSPRDVDEVIKRRILEKTDSARSLLEDEYAENEAKIKNLLTFKDSAFKRLYSDSKDFAEVFPFIPYQFDLLDNVLVSIRDNGASGAHMSNGERSMLALYKEAASIYANRDHNTLIPFSAFYAGLDEFIMHTHRDVVLKASRNDNLDKEFDVELLKVLLMLKYVKEIEVNVDNLTTLMISSIADERAEVGSKVQEALRRLEKETLIQKNGTIYTFLTNEEQDINRQIKNENVDPSDIIRETSEIIFEDIYKNKKFAYSPRYNFDFNKQVDDDKYKYSDSNAIGITIITPYCDMDMSLEALRARTAEGNAILVLPDNDLFLQEIKEKLQINKFLKKQGGIKSAAIDTIKRAKQDEAEGKKQRIKAFIEDALKNADIYVNSELANIPAKDPVSRINETLDRQVGSRYSYLSYMETSPTIAEIEKIFTSKSQMTIDAVEGHVPNHLALFKVQDYINTRKLKSFKTVLKNILDDFSRAPYGYVDEDVQWLVSTLFKQGKITFTINTKSVYFSDTPADTLFKYVTKKENFDKLVIDMRMKISEIDIRNTKEVMKNLCSFVTQGTDEDQIIKDFRGKLVSEKSALDKILNAYEINKNYPGIDNVNRLLGLINSALTPMEPFEFFKKIADEKNQWLDAIDDISQTKEFFNGSQKVIFDTSCKHIERFRRDSSIISNTEVDAICKNMREIVKESNPYSDIQKLHKLNDEFVKAYGDLLVKHVEPIACQIIEDKKYVKGRLKTDELRAAFDDKYTHLYDNLAAKVNDSKDISEIYLCKFEIENLKKKCDDEIDNYRSVAPSPNADQDLTNPNKAKLINKEAKPIRNVYFNELISITWRIENEEDMEKYLNELRNKVREKMSDEHILNIRM